MEDDIVKMTNKNIARFECNVKDSVIEDGYRIITTYEPVSYSEYNFYDEEKQRFNYKMLNNFIRDSGFIRSEKTESKTPNLYRFDLSTGFYEPVNYMELMTYISRTLVENDIYPSISAGFEKSLNNLLLALPNEKEVCGCPEYEELRKYYEDESTIAFKNGFYNIRHNRFLPLTSCIFKAYHVNVGFNPEALNKRYR